MIRELDQFSFAPAEMHDVCRKYAQQSKDPLFENKPQAVFDYVMVAMANDQALVLIDEEQDKYGKLNVTGYIICQVEHRPLLGIDECVIWQVASMFPDQRIARFTMQYIEKWAISKGCSIMRANSYRDGMEGLLKRYGYEFKLSIFEKELKKGD